MSRTIYFLFWAKKLSSYLHRRKKNITTWSNLNYCSFRRACEVTLFSYVACSKSHSDCDVCLSNSVTLVSLVKDVFWLWESCSSWISCRVFHSTLLASKLYLNSMLRREFEIIYGINLRCFHENQIIRNNKTAKICKCLVVSWVLFNDFACFVSLSGDNIC